MLCGVGGGVLGIASKPHTPFEESYVDIGQRDCFHLTKKYEKNRQCIFKLNLMHLKELASFSET